VVHGARARRLHLRSIPAGDVVTVSLDREVRRGDDTHAVFADAGLAFTIGLGRLPGRCPFKPGDWVRYHGYPVPSRSPRDPVSYGFRGYVLGGMGANLLRGVTDDGRDWCEPYGHLTRDGEYEGGGSSCICCPNPRLVRLAAEAAAAAEREASRPWDLLDLLAEMTA
jgi:hypothetical protein